MKLALLETQDSKSPTKDWMTVDELSVYLSISKSTIYKKLHQKQIPHYKPTGGTVWFRYSEIQSWLQSGKVADVQALSNSFNFLKPQA